jgi:hypothetical protein
MVSPPALKFYNVFPVPKMSLDKSLIFVAFEAGPEIVMGGWELCSSFGC